jgi:hypothetical protein
MRRGAFAAVASLLTASSFADEAPPAPPPHVKGHAYPVTQTPEALRDIYLHPDVWNGAWATFQGRITELRYNDKAQPLIQLEISSPQTRPSISLWATWVTRMDGEFIRPGDTIRIGGWLVRTDYWSAKLHLDDPPDDNPLMLASVCIVRLPHKDQLFAKDYLQYCNAWRDGEQPADMKVE